VCAIHYSILRCVTGEDEVAGFDRLVARETCFVHRFVGRFAVVFVVEQTPQPPVAAYFLESLTIN